MRMSTQRLLDHLAKRKDSYQVLVSFTQMGIAAIGASVGLSSYQREKQRIAMDALKQQTVNFSKEMNSMKTEFSQLQLNIFFQSNALLGDTNVTRNLTGLINLVLLDLPAKLNLLQAPWWMFARREQQTVYLTVHKLRNLLKRDLDDLISPSTKKQLKQHCSILEEKCLTQNVIYKKGIFEERVRPIIDLMPQAEADIRETTRQKEQAIKFEHSLLGFSYRLLGLFSPGKMENKSIPNPLLTSDSDKADVQVSESVTRVEF